MFTLGRANNYQLLSMKRADVQMLSHKRSFRKFLGMSRMSAGLHWCYVFFLVIAPLEAEHVLKMPQILVSSMYSVFCFNSHGPFRCRFLEAT